MWVVLLLAACSDGDSFSDSPSRLLTFSVDSVKLDTVFSRVPTPTKSFWVYNRSGKGIRCSSISLANGNQTGYRVNVDGIYLSPSAGFQAQNIEIRDKDSIRVFVELTAPENGISTPQKHEDDLVFTLESGVEQRVKLHAYTWDADVIESLTIDGDYELSGDLPTIVYGNIRVNEGATLTIKEGKTLYFHHGCGIDVYGRLVAEGTASKNVTLRGDRTDNMFDYLPYDLVSGQWSGIVFHESSYDNKLVYTDIHSTYNGVVCDSSDVSKTKLRLENSTIHNCQGDGLQARSCKLEVVNSQISNTLGHCLDVSGGNVTIQHTTLAQFYPFDSERGAALSFANGKELPLLFRCYNSLITGYAEDVVMGYQEDEDSAFDYQFVSSVIRTPEVFLPEDQTNGLKDVPDTLHFRQVFFEDPKDTVSMGEKHFELVNINTQHYDFRLSSASKAKDFGSAEYALSIDRLGRTRDDKPDAGCYER